MQKSMLGLVAGSCLMATTLPVTAGLVVSLQPGSLPASPGAHPVDIVVSGVSSMAAPVGIAAFQFEITYDPVLATPLSVAYGTDLGVSLEFDDLAANPLFVSATSLEALGYFAGQPDSFTLATVTFDAVGTAGSPLTLGAVVLADENGDTLALVPEPHEYAMLAGLGLAAFAVWRRRHA